MIYLGKEKLIYLAIILLIAGIDGFQCLPLLRELGSRPFYLFILPLILLYAFKKKCVHVNSYRLLFIAGLYFTSFIGFLLFGFNLIDFSSKNPSFQFLAQGFLFLVGMSSLVFSTKFFIKVEAFNYVIRLTLLLNLALISLDLLALQFNLIRPFEKIFYPEGSIVRNMPLGLFSEPSYLGACFAILTPIYLYNKKIIQVVIFSILLCAFFYFHQTRTFFVVFIPSMMYMLKIRYKSTVIIGLFLFLSIFTFYILSDDLGLFAVNENLSSAYRLGNTISYFEYSLNNTVFLGYGFGSSHFLFPTLDFIFGFLTSDEFITMLSGESENRALVFNLWVRLFIEIGILGSLMLLILIFRKFYQCKSDVVRMFFVPTFITSLSSDSFIYGFFWISLFLLFNFEVLDESVKNGIS